jgi:hypothetical protein
MCHDTRTTNEHLVRWKFPNPSALGLVSAGRPVGRSVHLYKVLVFAVGELYIIKTSYLTAKNLFWHVLQSATLMISESGFFLLYIVFLAIKVVNWSVMNLFIRMQP